jgi:hypothetical protein
LRNFESLSLKLLTVFGSCGLFVVAGNFSSESFIDYQNRIELRQLNQLVLRRAARKLGIKTIAEGIEQPSQLSWLRDIGVDEGQGVLVCAALPISDFVAFVEGRNAAGSSPQQVEASAGSSLLPPRSAISLGSTF